MVKVFSDEAELFHKLQAPYNLELALMTVVII